MGNCMSDAIAEKIYIEKRYDYDTKEGILKKVKDKIDLKIYDIYDNKKGLELKLKGNIFEKNILGLLKEINLLYDDYAKELLVNVINNIEKLEDITYEKIMRLAKKNDNCFKYRERKEYINDISYLTEDLNLFCDCISLISSEEIFVENYLSLWNILRDKIIMKLKNPLKTAIIITMSV